MTAVITASSAAFEFPNGRELFQNLNFTLETRLYSLVGPNGVGKTTLARLLSGELEPTRGRISRKGSITYFKQRLLPGDSTLSGGEWMKLRLAEALASEADFLILDEPTNDLDRSGREEVIRFLSEVKAQRTCGVLLISHDREILGLSENILELSNRGLSLFGLNWKDYLEEKDRERSRLSKGLEKARSLRDGARESRHDEKEKQEKRNRRGVAHAASGSLPKILIGGRKRQAQVSTGKIDVATLERAQSAVTDAFEAFAQVKMDTVMYAEFQSSEIPSQKLVAEAEEFNLRFPDRNDWLYAENLNFAWRGNVRVAIKGANGSGKSSLLKALLSQDQSAEFRGELKLGKLHSLYLDQQCLAVEDKLTVFENVREVSSLSETEIRNGLARFLFVKESVFQNASELSGGERLRLALAMGFLSGEIPELLILDEPTNNLDLANIEFLEGVVLAFRGALIVISHDEVFLENIQIKTMCSL